MNIGDDLLKSTPLGWARRWGRVASVKLLLEQGAEARSGCGGLCEAASAGGEEGARRSALLAERGGSAGAVRLLAHL
jgi:hypothetical protein